MRAWTAVFIATLIAGPVAAQDETTPSKLTVPYLRVVTDDSDSAKQRQTADELNVAIDDLKEACKGYEGRSRPFLDVLKLSLRINETYPAAFKSERDSESFEAQQLLFATKLESAVNDRKKQQLATELDVRQARFLRLTVELNVLRRGAQVPAGASTSAAPQPPPSSPSDSKPLPLTGRITARLLDLRGEPWQSKNYWSASGKLGGVVEGELGGAFQIALWDFDAGKLVRYLSSAEGQETKPYEGKDDADFGAPTTFSGLTLNQLTFSPDHRYAAGRVDLKDPTMQPGFRGQQLMIWEVATGKLLRTISFGDKGSGSLLFVDPVHLVTKLMNSSSVSLDMINVRTGKSEHLMPPNNFEMYYSTSRNGVMPLRTPGANFTLTIAGKSLVQLGPDPPEAGGTAHGLMWFSKDGRQLYVRRGSSLEVWNARTRQYSHSIQVVPAGSKANELGLAEDALMLVLDNWEESKLDLIDLLKGDVRLSIKTTNDYRNLLGMSSDGRRIGLIGPDKKVLLIDFPGGVPSGSLNVEQLLEQTKGQLLR